MLKGGIEIEIGKKHQEVLEFILDFIFRLQNIEIETLVESTYLALSDLGESTDPARIPLFFSSLPSLFSNSAESSGLYGWGSCVLDIGRVGTETLT